MKRSVEKKMISFAAVLVLAFSASGADLLNADFQGAATTDLLPLTAAQRNVILDSGTSIGSWADNSSAVNTLYKIAEDETGNKVLVFSSINNMPTLADADFTAAADLSINELIVSWDWMHADEGGGGTGEAIIELLDSSDQALFEVRWVDGGSLHVAGTGLGVFKRELPGVATTVLSSSNWDPLAMQLKLTDSAMEVSVGGVVQTNLVGVYTGVSGLRFKSTSNRSYSHGGMWIDNIRAELIPLTGLPGIRLYTIQNATP